MGQLWGQWKNCAVGQPGAKRGALLLPGREGLTRGGGRGLHSSAVPRGLQIFGEWRHLRRA